MATSDALEMTREQVLTAIRARSNSKLSATYFDAWDRESIGWLLEEVETLETELNKVNSSFVVRFSKWIKNIWSWIE